MIEKCFCWGRRTRRK